MAPQVAGVARELASGVVLLDEGVFHLQLRRELLFVNGATWFAQQAARHREMAREWRRDGALDDAAEMDDVADGIEALLAAAMALPERGLWPQIHHRSLLQPWSVEANYDSRLRYAKGLLEFGAHVELQNPEFALVLRNGKSELWLTKSLKNRAEHAGPFEVREVQGYEILSLVGAA